MRSLALLFMAAGCAAFGGTLSVVAPNTGLGPPATPWSGAAADTSDLRFQEIIGTGQLNSLTSPVEITGIDFRSAPGAGPFSLDLTGLAIVMGYSRVAPNSYSGHTPPYATYNTNFFSNGTQVYNGPDFLSDSGCSTEPCPFDMHVNFSTPFIYDRSQGHSIVLDMALFPPAVGPPVSGALDGISWPDLTTNNGVASVEGGIPGNSGTVYPRGLFVQLDYTELTPEPASWVLLVPAIAALAWLRRRRP